MSFFVNPCCAAAVRDFKRKTYGRLRKTVPLITIYCQIGLRKDLCNANENKKRNKKQLTQSHTVAMAYSFLILIL